VRTLLATGRLQLDACDGDGCSLLLLAARMRATSPLVAQLLAAGADPAVANQVRATSPLVAQLLAAGADPAVANQVRAAWAVESCGVGLCLGCVWYSKGGESGAVGQGAVGCVRRRVAG
jgi:hypothetical protein